jgi:hypothetical protein
MARFLIAALEGDMRDRLSEIVRACGKKPLGPVQVFPDWNSISAHVQKTGGLMAACSGGWTILDDPGLLDTIPGAIFEDSQLGAALARRINGRVVAAIGEDTMCVYGFRVYSLQGTRAVLVSNRGCQEMGDPMPGESRVDWAHANEEDVLLVLQSLGIDIEDGVAACREPVLLQYGEDE